MKFNFFCFLFLLIFSLSLEIHSQGFNSIHTPDGTNIIAVGNNGLYFRSSNGGNAWGSYLNGTENMRSVYSIGDDVWIAASDGKIFKTFKVNSPLSLVTTGSVEDLNSIFFVNNSTGFVCGNNGVILKTTDAGITWFSSFSGSVNFNSISFKDESNGVVVGDGGNIFLTDNGGQTWTSQAPLTTGNLLNAKYFDDGIGITGEDGIIIVKNGQGNFELINTRTDSDISGITGLSINEIHVCGGGGFVRNNKNGVSNFFNFEINPMMADLVDIHYHDGMNGWAVSSLNKAIIRTTNGGESWSLPPLTVVSYSWELKLSPGVSGLGNNLCRHPHDKNSIFVMYGQKVYASRDKGNTWGQIATVNVSSGTPHSFFVSPVDTNIWVAATKGTPNKVIRTTNYGQTWSIVLEKNFTTYGQPLEMDQNDPSVYYFVPVNSAGEGMYKSTNNGATFNLIAPYNQSGIGSPCDILVMWDSSNVMFLGDDGADVWKSTDGGQSWFLVKPNSSSEIPSMCSSVFKKNQIYATTWGSSEVFRTQNYGDNWSIVSNNTGSGWGSDVCREDPTLVLTASYGAQAYLSTNNGAGFSTVSSGLSGSGAGIIVTDRGTLIDQRTSGLYKMKIIYDIITDVNENIISSAIPGSFNLYQNYPNPFNPSTKISFDIKNASDVKLIVYDIVGKEVKTLVNGFKQPGQYEVEFNAQDLSSGIYYYRISAGEFISTKKMLLVK
jgi:photosystem II stability/assembly factor-like uncharacterized protein